ncbi:MAG: translation initiation factor IF-3 [Planctomycetes bacterium RIFCSPHIGHO2_02_FULL_50_42]|nr:MAG: translation initiation factor IF-3 [Planctomycetes bacterium GWA2_50_13]OHB90026.1 MAG: translation initiation factor IF-3 [Planctomycetes bacterium RIFCSPHIGHO2_02_FULL_50_42]OHB95855.1 MAG: translation initiation factor IF-3 [Planctomycetes bacterium RIFCSPLOWO2_02_FULL_50_16]OHC04414.1 MAG: translation initiation factor IF-3 [Planctomycetes bacterium RIFCSPLOWO2_12_FULL_50_35]
MAAREVRLIGEAGEQFGIVPREEALKKARESDLDLVEVAAEATPPVCRLMNYGKFKYRQKKAHHKPHVTHLKELRLRPKTDAHDLETKIRQARKFLEKKDKVLVNMIFRGRERMHTESAKGMLDEFIKALEDVAKIEKTSAMDGRRMGIILAPK